MDKRIRLALLTATITFTSTLYAHGEDKLGPHKGYIRMPGAYHVEVIPQKNSLDIMLLDANFKNPTVLNSHIKAKIASGDHHFRLKCESMPNYFSCPVNHKMLAHHGTLTIESKRRLSEGAPVSYPLPLKLTKQA
tara:strand:+ start:1155 stop:1559 length:405 start_codon:yes stop_codon:yes gene_type:complete